jgi:phosphoglycerate dehydrogenase-like enzyme
LNILFCDEGYSEARRRLAALLPDPRISACAADHVIERLEGVDIIVPYLAAIDERIIRAGNFGLVQQFGVGLETVDVDAATRAGVWVARIPSAGTGNAESVAEHALLLMLALARRLPQVPEHIRARHLGEPAGIALAGKTACIVGLGSAGGALASRLAAMEMRLVAARKNLKGTVPLGVLLERTHDLAHLAEAVRDADFVIITARYEPDSLHLFDRTVLQAMKPGAFLVNVARGGFVDKTELGDALRSGHLGGAGLDVIEGEPIDPNDQLLGLNVVLTPHVAGVTDLSYEGIAREFAHNVLRYSRGEPPAHAVNSPPHPRAPRAR